MSTLEETVSIQVEGDEHVAGTLVTPGTLLPGVLFVHGWGGSQQQYVARARAVAELGCICLAFNLRGHVETEPQFETVSRSENLRDAEAAYDRLVAHRHVDPQAVAVVGSSYGGDLASILTTMRPVRWLGLRAPALYLDSGWDLPKLQLRVDQDLVNDRRHIVDADSNRALQACQAFGGDMRLIQSEHDSFVPAAVLTRYRQASTQTRSLTYRCIKDADHGLSSADAQRAYTGMLVAWMKEMLLHAHDPARDPQPEPDTRVAPESAPPTLRSGA